MLARIIVLLATLVAPIAAQWLNQPTPGIPRKADGKPDLTAPTPKAADGHPDLSGLWRVAPNPYAGNILANLKSADLQPGVEALYKQRMEDLGKDDPSGYKCLPFGPRFIVTPDMSKVIQSPGLIIVLFEDLTYRQIFLDGRALPQDPNPSWMGYSTGRWEGETLVVESNGFNSRTWLDGGGHPHSEDLRITERFRRRDIGHMDLQITLADPKVAAKPWTLDIELTLAIDNELIEYVCGENEKDVPHLVGKASDEKKLAVKVAPEILAQYTGAYEFRIPEDPDAPFVINVTFVSGELLIDLGGKDPQPLIPLSEVSFAGIGGRMEFVKNDQGAVTHAIFKIVEGDLKGIRK